MHKTIEQKFCWIKDQVKEIDNAFKREKGPGSSTGNTTLRWLRWMKPDQGWYALSIDGCVDNAKDKAGCGGVIRDDEGSWITCFSTNLGSCSVDERKV